MNPELWSILISAGVAVLGGVVSAAATVKMLGVHIKWLHKQLDTHERDDKETHIRFDERIRTLEKSSG